MKKLISFLLCVLVFLPIICIAGCEKCEHEFVWKLYKEGTCIEADIYEGLCVKCGEKSAKDGDKKAHSYDSFGICDVCGATENEGNEEDDNKEYITQDLEQFIVSKNVLNLIQISSVRSMYNLSLEPGGVLNFHFFHPIEKITYWGKHVIVLTEYQSVQQREEIIYKIEIANSEMLVFYDTRGIGLKTCILNQIKGLLVNKEKEVFIVYNDYEVKMVGKIM